MTYSKNKKQNGIGREYRGRKPKTQNSEVQRIIDSTVEELQGKIAEEYDAKLKAKWATEGRQMNKKGQVAERTELIVMPDSRFDHPGLYEGTTKYTPADKLAALTAYLITGSFEKASTHCAVPAQTIKSWKNKSEWWPALSAEIKKEKNDELEGMLTGILHKGLEDVIDRLEKGDTYYDARRGETYILPPKTKDVATVVAMLFDKRALMRGDPTRRVESVSTDQRLSKLKEQFEKFSNATEVEGEVVKED